MSRRKRPDDLILEPTYLAEWRKFRNMSLEEVGKLIGVDKTGLSRMERGVSPYDQIRLQQLRDIYRVSIPDLLYTDPKRQTQPNKFGKVGFENTTPPRQKMVPKTPKSDLADLMAKVKLPEEVDAVKLLIEALAARRKDGE